MDGSKQENPHANRGKSEIVLGSCLVEGDMAVASTSRHSRREAFGISLAFETVVLGLLIVVPLFSSIAQPHLRPMLPVQITFFRPVQQPRQDQSVLTNFAAHVGGIFDPYQRVTLIRPAEADSRVDGPMTSSLGSEEPDIPGAIPMTEGGVMPLLREPKPVAPTLQVERRAVKMSQGVLQAQLINRIEPHYPSIAVLTKTEGTVLLHAFISRDGRITSLEVISGNPLLIRAAIEAVQQWQYRPTMLSGEPVEVETTIAVVFRLRN
jgi:periplasmic protein TonB